MSLLCYEEADRIIQNIYNQLNDGRVLYEGTIIAMVEEFADRTEKNLLDFDAHIYSQYWILINIPKLQSDKMSIQEHHERVMREKLEYYRRTNNYDGLCIWISSILTNIGFTLNQADTFLCLIEKVGENLRKKANLKHKL
jgi:hypothetical protein